MLLFGLALALDGPAATSGLGAQGQSMRIGAGVALALVAAASFGVVMVVTQRAKATIDGRLRRAVSMALAWALLGQRIAPVQVLGGLIIVGTLMVPGLRQR